MGEDGNLFDEADDEPEVGIPGVNYDNSQDPKEDYAEATQQDEAYDQPNALRAEALDDYLAPAVGDEMAEDYAEIDENADYDEPVMGDDNIYGIDSAMPVEPMMDEENVYGIDSAMPVEGDSAADANVDDDEFDGDGFAGAGDDEFDE